MNSMNSGNRSPLIKELSPRVLAILLGLLVLIWILPHGHTTQSASQVPPETGAASNAMEPGRPGSGIMGSLDLSRISRPWSSPKGILSTKRNDLLVIYVYKETDNALENARFFIQLGLHNSADFIFIINGEAPRLDPDLPEAPNIEIVRRENTCFDLGAYGHVLRDKKLLSSHYKKFILLNASIRGPFMPTWSNECWSTAWLARLSDKMKLQGSTVNCAFQFHIQSMIFGTDKEGLQTMLDDGTFACADSMQNAVGQEIQMASKIMSHGWDVNAWMTALHGDPTYEDRIRCGESGNNDPNERNWYFGFNVHPYETIFAKANRNAIPMLLDKFTEWHKRMNYSSYDRC